MIAATRSHSDTSRAARDDPLLCHDVPNGEVVAGQLEGDVRELAGRNVNIVEALENVRWRVGGFGG